MVIKEFKNPTPGINPFRAVKKNKNSKYFVINIVI